MYKLISDAHTDLDTALYGKLLLPASPHLPLCHTNAGLQLPWYAGHHSQGLASCLGRNEDQTLRDGHIHKPRLRILDFHCLPDARDFIYIPNLL